MADDTDLRLLPAPRRAGLLLAHNPCIVKRVPTDNLSRAELALLETAARFALAPANRGIRGTEFEGFVPIAKHNRALAETLVDAGYMERHPNKRKRMWFAVTALGQQRIALEEDTVDRRGYDPTTRTWRDLDSHRPEIAEQIERFEALARDLALQGYIYMPEPGRGPTKFEVAFYNPFSGRSRLYQFKSVGWLKSGRRKPSDWYERLDGYYRLPDWERDIVDTRGIVVNIPSAQEVAKMIRELDF